MLKVQENAIRVTWKLPQCSSNIKEIKVQSRKVGQCNWKLGPVVKSSNKEATIKGLEIPGKFEVRVVVVDINGNQHISNTSVTEEIGKNSHWCNFRDGCLKL